MHHNLGLVPAHHVDHCVHVVLASKVPSLAGDVVDVSEIERLATSQPVLDSHWHDPRRRKDFAQVVFAWTIDQ